MMRNPGRLGTVVAVWESGAGWPIVAAAACLAAMLLAVRLVRVRRAFDKALQERGWLLERERESAAQNAVDAERARIAQELHDIVSHNVSVMVIQAGAAREVLTPAPDEAATALLAVETAGRDTMTELRHLLGVLAPSLTDDGDEPVAPVAAAEPEPAQPADRPDRLRRSARGGSHLR